jgi:hypothetical protein
METISDGIVFWAVAPGTDELRWETIDEAIEDFLDRWFDEVDFFMPDEVEVVGYARIVPDLDGRTLLESVLGKLDDELGSPKGDYISPRTPHMIEAAETFAKVICEEYESWMCEEVKRIRVNLLKDEEENA